MEYTSLWLFNVFVIFMFGWFYFYFYSMFVALADINEDLISLVHKKTNNGEVEGQTKLSDFIEEEQGEILWLIQAIGNRGLMNTSELWSF